MEYIPNNFVSQKFTVTDKDFKALDKAKKLEHKRKKHGYRWFKVGTRTRIFVPCDKDGNPTEEGLKKIEALKKML